MDISRSGRSRFTTRRVAAWCVAAIIAVALLGSFDFVRFDAMGSFSIVETSSLGSRQGDLRSPIVPGDAVHLGAFDMDMERRWRFLDARESAERLLPPGG